MSSWEKSKHKPEGKDNSNAGEWPKAKSKSVYWMRVWFDRQYRERVLSSESTQREAKERFASEQKRQEKWEEIQKRKEERKLTSGSIERKVMSPSSLERLPPLGPFRIDHETAEFAVEMSLTHKTTSITS